MLASLKIVNPPFHLLIVNRLGWALTSIGLGRPGLAIQRINGRGRKFNGLGRLGLTIRPVHTSSLESVLETASKVGISIVNMSYMFRNNKLQKMT